jgi:alpha-tubulin suppressor-like RCC1 family protein
VYHIQKVNFFKEKGITVHDISCGREHVYFITDHGVYATGRNQKAQLGLGHQRDEVDYPVKVPIEGISKIYCGGYFTVFQKHDGSFYGVGDSENGQLGTVAACLSKSTRFPYAGSPIVSCSAGFYHVLFLTSSGHVYMCGSSDCGVIGEKRGIYTRPNISSPVYKAVTGNHFSALVTVKGEVYVAGDCQHETYSMWTRIVWNKPVPLQELHAGAHHLLLVGKHANIYAFGYVPFLSILISKDQTLKVNLG